MTQHIPLSDQEVLSDVLTILEKYLISTPEELREQMTEREFVKFNEDIISYLYKICVRLLKLNDRYDVTLSHGVSFSTTSLFISLLLDHLEKHIGIDDSHRD